MEHNFMMIPTLMLKKQAIAEVTKCNETTTQYGLVLTQADAQKLVETREEALNSNGRIEFGGGVIDKIILKFCDSPYLSQFHYSDTLHQLIDTFYYFKNETLDKISDDELITLMKKYFDKSCQGSVDLLQGRELEKLAHNIRYGIKDYADISEKDEEKPDEDELNQLNI